MAWREGLLFKIVNVGSYSLFSWSNYYAIASPHSVYGNIKQTYFTPAVWAFFAWPIVHFLLLGTIIYQFTSAHAKATVIDRISWWFPILTILNSIFVAVWAYDYSIAAFVLSFFVFWAVNRIYFIKKDHSPESLGDAFFVHLPFSTWHGWAVVNIFFTAFEAFGTDATIRPADIPTEVGVFLSLFILWGTAATYAHNPSPGGDLAGASVISWTLWAIFYNQHSSAFIRWSALAFAVLSLISVLGAAHGVYLKLTTIVDEERGPLLGH